MGKLNKPIVVPGGAILKVGKGNWLANRYGQAAQTTHGSREAAVALLATKPTSREATTMKVKAKVTKKGSKPAKAAKASKATTSKRERASHDNDALRAKVAAQLKKGTSLGDIADALSITVGKAAFLNMLNEVEDNPKLRIKGRNEDEIVANAVKAREAQDEHSSWGWLSARSGIAEGRLKTLCEAAGVKVKGSHVAKERAASKPVKAPKAKAAKKGGKGKGDPSK